MALSFASALPPNQAATLADAIVAASGIGVTPCETIFDTLAIAENGTVSLSDEVPYRITKYGLKTLCTLLGIPPTFAFAIPDELLLINIRTLLAEKAYDEISVLFRNSDPPVISAIVEAPYKEPSSDEVIGLFSDRSPEMVPHIEVGELLSTMTILLPQEHFEAPYGGMGQLQAAMQLTTSVVGAVPTSLCVALYRPLMQTTILLPVFGKLRWNYNQREDRRGLTFHEKSSGILDDTLSERLRTLLRRAIRTPLYEHEWASVWQKLSLEVGTMDADEIMQCDEDTRRMLLSSSMQYHRSKKESLLYGFDNDTSGNPTTTFAWDLAWRIAGYAKDETAELSRFTLESLAGSIVQQFVLRV